MPSILNGANILITGASSGLGVEFAKQLAPRAKSLILVAKSGDKLEDLSNQLKSKNQNLDVVVKPCDLSNVEDVKRMLESLDNRPPVDVLINNAGLGDWAYFDKSEWERDLQMIQVNVIGLTMLTHKLLPKMVARGKGGIINIGSGASVVTIPGASVYNATKHYVDGFSESLLLDLAGTGVVVTQVCPGPVSTGGLNMEPMTKKGGPSLVQISPKQCVCEAIRAFDNKQSKVYPGFIFRWLLWFYSWIPSIVVRTIGKTLALGIRSQEQKAISDK